MTVRVSHDKELTVSSTKNAQFESTWYVLLLIKKAGFVIIHSPNNLYKFVQTVLDH